MTPIERLNLKCLKFLISQTESNCFNQDERIDLMNEIDCLENHERREESCCDMEEFAKQKQEVKKE